jgi:predicted ATPase
LSAAHGGQILITGETSETLAGKYLPETSFRDLGSHRLKDLQQPVHVFQVEHPELPSSFPPLRSLQAQANNLPVQLTSFIGRERELADTARLLGSARLLTLTGPGGCGKTRLALHCAADVLEEYPHGVWLSELASVPSGTLVLQTIAWSLGVREEPGVPLEHTLIEYLRNAKTLLILDNCEHQVSEIATIVTTLLRSCPNIRIMTTSREPLGVQGEVIYRVPSMQIPEPDDALGPTPLLQMEAVRLFAERAVVAAPTFALTNQNVSAVAQVCHRLDGIPLAIELAAARVRVLPIEQIAARLDDRFRLLTGGSRTALAQHQTLRALIDWSYDLLTESEKSLLRRLSVFSRSLSLEAAEAVCADDSIESWEILDLLTQLVDKSLVMTEEVSLDGRSETRYHLLQTVRQYGQDRLMESGEVDDLLRRHAEWFSRLAEDNGASLQGASQASALDALQLDQSNIRAAIDWALNNEPSMALAVCTAMWRFWHIRSHWTEGRDQLARALERHSGEDSGEIRAEALRAAGVLALYQTDYTAAESLLNQSLELSRRLGDMSGAAAALSSLGNVAWRQGDYETAKALYREGLTSAEERNDAVGTLRCLINLGNVACQQCEYEEARNLYENAAQINTSVKNRAWDAVITHNLGDVAYSTGDYGQAQMRYDSSLEIARELKDDASIARSLTKLGQVATQKGDTENANTLYHEALETYRNLRDRLWEDITLSSLGELAMLERRFGDARTLYCESLTIAHEVQDKYRISLLLLRLASVAVACGDFEHSAVLYGAADSVKRAIGAPIPPNEKAAIDEQVARAREELGVERFEVLCLEGSSLSLADVVAAATAQYIRAA